MTLCKFFQQGNCRFGNSCRFEHVSGGGAQPSNRFGALGGGNGSSQQFLRDLDKYYIKLDALESDLTTELPTWILSAYAPGREAPDQLFGGPAREQSFEEMRLHHMKGKAEGNEEKVLAEAQELYHNAQAQMQTAVRNVGEAAKYILEGENRHPNRLDICRQGTQGAPFGEFLVGKRPKSLAPEQPAAANPFASNSNTASAPPPGNPFASNSNTTNTPSPFGGGGANPAPAPSAFGQPSALGQKPNPFGTPAFGQPAQPSAFGQPAQQQTPSPFGQPSQPPQPSAFGQPSQPTTSAFGQPSALGAKPSAFGAPAFGQSAQPNAGGAQPSAFGQPSQLGQKPNPFGGNANAGPSPFAAAANNNDKPANPFGGNSNAGVSPFAAAASSNEKPANPFGAPTTTNNQTGQPAPNPFGSATPVQNNAASPFGQPSATPSSNPFASGTSTTPAGNPFATGGQQAGGGGGGAAPNPFAAAQSNAQPPPNPFGSAPARPAQPAAPTGNPYPPGSAKQHPPAESYISMNMDGTLAAFKGKAVTYSGNRPGIRAFDGTWTRIWFPAGPPNYNKDTALPMDAYDDGTKAQWQRFEQTGQFADGLMPLLPPPRECTVWDF